MYINSSERAQYVSPKTRGLSLESYEGKEVTLSFRLRSNDGDLLLLDNIGIYSNVNTGVNTIGDNKTRVVATSNNVSAQGALAIVIVDITGRTVASVQGDTLNIDDLAAGIYVAQVKTAHGMVTHKFVK